MSSLQPGPSSSSQNTTTQEFIVRLPKDRKRKFSVMKFGSGAGVDFTRLGDMTAKMERENNLKEYKTANDLDTMPKFGAGSEYGRDLKEEARRKKYGIIMKKYNPEDQPWLLRLGAGKQARKYKGVREGTISENTSYYIFVQSPDGAFEAIPAQEWYNFAPVSRYKYLNADEAEEEFSRRDKTLNYFNIMLKKRMKNEEKEVEPDEGEKPANKRASKSKKKNKDFLLTDMDEWADLSDIDDDDDMDDEEEEKPKDEGDKSKKKGKAKGKGKRVKNAKQNSDDEAVEESDEGDFDDREVDYMSDTSSSMSEPEEKEKKYEEKGVAEEAGLRNILASDGEDDEEEEANEEEENEEDKEKEDDQATKDKKNESESSSSSSDSESDIDKDEKITSALLMQKEKMDKKKAQHEKSEKNMWSVDATDSKGVKRKAEADGPNPKKARSYSPLPSVGSSSSDGITEEAIRRYLQRKPMTTKDLLQKFRSKKLNMTSEQMTHTIVQLLKRINPEKTHVNKKLYLSLKKPE
ncbi:general transcription factor IIF subunit 1-like isoform X2 [Pomacea canaliculata]|uniref:general transcription factor IIF subunit 1-like isoform X2 n=1 Tax=Pomacea canaliculata TaxID=400727 RepID=UPI000D7381FB|nr:general transcription factor IIF subunit 1-like isoform X2 [Pomacea canaliculata]